VDVANPVVIVNMDDVVPKSAGFDPAAFQSPERLSLLEDLRVAAALAMGLVRDEETARNSMTNLPLVAIVRRPTGYLSTSGLQVESDKIDAITQMISMGLPHKATPLTGAMCLAAASKIVGTIANDVVNRRALDREEFRLGHPSGVLQLTASCEKVGDEWRVPGAGVFRTARRLFDGHVFLPQ
jgi:2-methylaconitate cis-trans-isomerase PrpF